MNSPSNTQIIGIVLLVLGAGFVIWGYQESTSIGAQMQSRFSGSPSDKMIHFRVRMWVNGTKKGTRKVSHLVPAAPGRCGGRATRQ